MEIIEQIAQGLIGGVDVAPAFKVKANGTDITDKLNERLISLRLTDESGDNADEVDIALSDHGEEELAIPEPGTELEVSLGYDGTLVEMGKYIIDEIEITGPPDTVNIRARAVVQTEGAQGSKILMTTQKTRSWEAGITLGDLVRSVGAEHGIAPTVASEFNTIVLPHIDQVNESDMALLTRLSKQYDAIAKPSGDYLVFAKRGELTTPSGTSIPDVDYTREQTCGHRLLISRRVKSGSVIARYRDIPTASTLEIKVGTGEPAKRLTKTYGTEDEAQAAADAEYKRSQRNEQRLELDVVGNPYLVAGGAINVSGFRSGINGQWLIDRVEHEITKRGGYSCGVQCKQI